MGGSRAPKPDKRIGKAALKMAETGEDYLGWMRDQAAITNQWAAEDRRRYQTEFRPLEREFIREAKRWDSPGALRKAARTARSDVRGEVARSIEGSNRQMAAMGVNPASGRFAGVRRALSVDGALAAVGAGNMARDQRRREGVALRGDAVNLGKGFQVNPGTAMGISNSALASGASGAMSGYQGMGQMLGQQDQMKMQAWQADQSSRSDLFGAIGMGAGLFLSSKKAKRKMRSIDGHLKAVKETPVESWEYKPGMGDGGGKRHVGPYAEDFQKATGLGDGKTIAAVDAIGVTMGAVKELDKKVERIARSIEPLRKAA